MTVSVAAATGDLLGEGPVHDTADGSLRWVDIGRALWHRLDLGSGEVSTVAMDRPLTAFAPTDAGDYIGAFTGGIARLDRTGRRGPWLARPEQFTTGNRFNDAGTDPWGRFIAGTLGSGEGPTGALYSWDGAAPIRTLLTGLGIANTVAFSPDGRVLYTADTASGALTAHSYDVETGRIGSPVRGFRSDPGLPGRPDGSAVDNEGYLWNARWDGGCVVRLAPDGSTDRVVHLPAQLVTSCCFVGSALYVTTSTWGFAAADRLSQPLAGSLLRVKVGVTGLPRAVFATHSEARLPAKLHEGPAQGRSP